MASLENRRYLITGGTSGIGLAVASRCIDQGARVMLTGSSDASVAMAREQLGDKAICVRSDAGDLDAQAELAAQVAAQLGGLDAAILNAGVAEFRPLEALDVAGYQRCMSVNFGGPLFLIKALVPRLSKGSAVVLTSSNAIRLGMPNTAVYAASKAALDSLARSLSAELLPRGIRLNSICPGPVATPLFGKTGMSTEVAQAAAAQILQGVPAGRFADADEIAAAIMYLASPDSAFMIGSQLVIDGGMSTL